MLHLLIHQGTNLQGDYHHRNVFTWRDCIPFHELLCCRQIQDGAMGRAGPCSPRHIPLARQCPMDLATQVFVPDCMFICLHMHNTSACCRQILGHLVHAKCCVLCLLFLVQFPLSGTNALASVLGGVDVHTLRQTCCDSANMQG